MGKTYAAKVNKRLIDFDDVIREEKNNLSKKLGFDNVRDMQMSKDPNVQKVYKDLLIAKIKEFKGNPSNSGKTMVVSNHALVNEPLFDNIPSIPSKNEFVTRSIRRGDTAENAKD